MFVGESVIPRATKCHVHGASQKNIFPKKIYVHFVDTKPIFFDLFRKHYPVFYFLHYFPFPHATLLVFFPSGLKYAKMRFYSI